jgi:hypothetical protein
MDKPKEVVKQSNQSAAVAAAKPPKVDFKTWKKKFDGLLRVKTDAWLAVEALLCREEAWLEQSLSKPVPDRRTARLNYVYNMTSCSEFPKNILKEDEYTRKKLDEVTSEIEAFMAHIEKREAHVLSTDGLLVMDMSPVFKSFKMAALASRNVLACLQPPYARLRKVTDDCLSFLINLNNLDIPEKQAFALCKLALIAHGFKDTDLEEFTDEKIFSGNVRKRRNALDAKLRRSYKVKNLLKRI